MKTKIGFTESRIRELPRAKNDRDYYYDLTVPSLELRVTGSGSKSFNVYLWSSKLKKAVRVYLGKSPTLQVEQARRLAIKAVSQILEGHNPNTLKRRDPTSFTFGQAIDAYFHSLQLSERKITTISTYRYLNERFLGSLQNTKMSELTRDAILSLRLKIRDQTGANAVPRTKTRQEKPDRKATANKTIRLLSQVFNHAINAGWSGANPCAGIRSFPEVPASKRLEENELEPFIQACERAAVNGDTIADFLLTCLFSGIRKANVAQAKWKDIDLKAGIWHVPDTKNGLPITVYLSGLLMEVFRRRAKVRSFSPFVFTSNQTGGQIIEPRRGLNRILKTSGIASKGFTIHALKHTFVSCAYECGLNPVLVSRLGGHKVQGVTGRYGHASDSRIREAYKIVAQYMQNVRPHRLAEASNED